MSMDAPLFGDPTPNAPASPPATKVSDWQVDLLRKALNSRGLTEQQARRALIEQYAGRPLTSLRDLTSEEALQVVTALGRSARQAQPSGSAWDEREDDTWIDRL